DRNDNLAVPAILDARDDDAQFALEEGGANRMRVERDAPRDGALEPSERAFGDMKSRAGVARTRRLLAADDQDVVDDGDAEAIADAGEVHEDFEPVGAFEHIGRTQPVAVRPRARHFDWQRHDANFRTFRAY